MQAGFEVLNAGVLTLLEDKGRFGFNDIGVTQAGVMDEYAFLWANKLLNNDLNAACLEVLYSGLRLKATASCVIALTGANLQVCLNDCYIQPWQTYNLQAGDILHFTKSLNGQRAYLGVKKGFKVQKVFGSCSTSIKEKLGLFQGRAIQTSDFLPYKSSFETSGKKVKQSLIPKYEKHVTLRVVLGYQEALFDESVKERFFSSTYTISNENNRMGMKLTGEAIACNEDGIISEGIAYGAIQIPKDGQPIILLKERQTIGGYPKIGSVLSIDCFKLSQMKAGNSVRFEPISIAKAQEKLKDFYEMFET